MNGCDAASWTNEADAETLEWLRPAAGREAVALVSPAAGDCEDELDPTVLAFCED